MTPFRLLAPILALALTAHAQDSSATIGVDTVLKRADALVDAGRAAAGRALVDSVLTAATPGTEAYAQALYARASLAATAGDAERDYLRLTVEYSLSPRSSDALLRLAQLELARGDRTTARAHLARLTEDRPAGLNTPRANLSVARAYQELGDQPHACTALAAAQHAVVPADVELKNQIDYAARPCPAAPPVEPSTTKVAAATTPVVAPPTQSPAPTTPPTTPTPVPTQPLATSAPVAPVAPQDTQRAAADTPTTKSVAAAKAAFATPSRPAPASHVGIPLAPRPIQLTGGYTVQVAAYATRAPADALAAKLTARGLPARVSGTAAPFRVRVGRYPTRVAAESASADLKSKQITGFVTDAEPAGH